MPMKGKKEKNNLRPPVHSWIDHCVTVVMSNWFPASERRRKYKKEERERERERETSEKGKKKQVWPKVGHECDVEL